jgi:hypothetical protein
LLPRLEVRQKHPLQTIAKRPTDAEHCRQIVAPRTGHELALVGRTGHSSVTWQLMLGKNLLWVAKQHGHSVEVMLRMYAAWLEGATDADIHAIKKAMEKRPDARAALLDSRSAISAVNTVSNRVTQIVIRPLKSSEFGSRERPE